jgi:hypothetical protein
MVNLRRFLFCTVISTACQFGGNPGGANAGFIHGSLSVGPAVDQNLTSEGTEDWAIWGYANGGTSTSLAPDVHMAGGSGISDLSSISNGNPLRAVGDFGSFAHTFDWSNGTPVPTAIGAQGGIQHDGEQPPMASNIGEGFSFTVPADTMDQTLRVYVTAHLGIGTLIATLSDSSAKMYIQSLDGSTTPNDPGVYTITYVADSASQTLNVTYVLTAENDFNPLNSSNAALYAVSLAVPEPSTVVLTAMGGLALLAWRRRRG